jgi:transcriptional regulator
MYQVPQFREESLAVQHDLIRANPLGMLISQGADGLLANPIPFLLYDEGDKGTLRCHLSRGNPQWLA